MDADIAAHLLKVRAAALARGDVALVAEIDHNYPRLLAERRVAPETARAPVLENAMAPRPTRTRHRER